MYASKFKHTPKATHSLGHYSKMQSHQLENLKRELELKQVGPQSNAMRNKLLQYRDKINYQNEMDKIRGCLTRGGPRLPPTTIERLRRRQKELKKLGAMITN